MGKNDVAWEKLFEKYNILSRIEKDGVYIISSKEINEFREARLMTKFDNEKVLPRLFKENGLAILPISNTNYIIGRFKLYEKIPEIEEQVEYLAFPNNIESIDYNKINSEAIAISCASISNMLEDFLEEKELVSTVNGKMSSEEFEFVLSESSEPYSINVDGTQIEIDGGFESEKSIILIEAKNVIADEFLVRQLYYPYRLWKKKTHKNIRTVFMQYNNGIFNLYEYTFTDENDYNSIELIKSKRYTLISEDEGKVSKQDVLKVYNSIKIVEEPNEIFPQADSFARIVNFVELLNNDYMKSKEEITEEYQFTPRQTDYYYNAGRYLGLLTCKNIDGENKIVLTENGNKLFDLSVRNRQLEFIKLILRHKVFYDVFSFYIDEYRILSNGEIVELMKKSVNGISAESVYVRRASTIRGWVEWIINFIK